MAIVNRRNAFIGWLAWEIVKRVGRRKARAAVPRLEEGRPNKGLVLTVLAAAAAAAALVWWRRGADGTTDAE